MTRLILDWNALKIFFAITQSKTLAGAALSLKMSHSTVYRRINEFEEEVGRLFERVNGHYELTQLGDEMLMHAQAINNSFDNVERSIAGKDMQPKGVVRITAPSSFSYNLLPQHLAKFNQLYPDIKIELLVTNLALNMTNRLADIAIRVTSTPPEHLVGREVRRIKWGVYASENYLTEHGRPHDLNALVDHRLIGAAGQLLNRRVFSTLSTKYAQNISQSTDDLIAMSCMVKSGLGIAILPDDLNQASMIRLFTFDLEKENQLWILTHPDLRKVERIKIVMKYLNEVLAD